MRKTGKDVTIDKPNTVKISKYNDDIETKYME